MFNLFNILLCIIISQETIIFNSNAFVDKFSTIKSFRNCIKKFGLSNESVVDQDTNPTLYEQVNHQWNLRLLHVNPLAYFLPTSTRDVQIAVRCASKKQIPVIPKSGGHSYESYSFGTTKSLVIDFQKMNQILVQSDEKTAIIESGALLGPIYVKLWRAGGFGLPAGICLSVGIGGHALGGGHGVVTSLYGYTLHNILEMTMVDADGKEHTVNSTKNPDLYWALRGVGSGYIGIVTKFKFKIFQASNLSISVIGIFYDIKHIADVFDAWQKLVIWKKQNSYKFYCQLYIVDGNQVSVAAIHVQDNINIKHYAFLRMIKNIFPKTKNKIVWFPSYMDLILKLGVAPVYPNKLLVNENDLLDLPKKMIPQFYYKSKSFLVNKLFKNEDLKKIVQIFQRMPKSVQVTLVVSDNLTEFFTTPISFSHTKFYYDLQIEATNTNNNTEEFKNALAWVEDFVIQTKFMDNGETYQNLVDSDLKDYMERYYGTSVQELIRIKKKWDPKNYFQNPQSIPIV